MSTTPKQPHPHAAIIHAYADGAEIQMHVNGEWLDNEEPLFLTSVKYRVKPVREYPTTCMTPGELGKAAGVGVITGDGIIISLAGIDYTAVANAALRDAIDNCQVVMTGVVEKLARELAELKHPDCGCAEVDDIARDIFRKAMAGEL